MKKILIFVFVAFCGSTAFGQGKTEAVQPTVTQTHEKKETRALAASQVTVDEYTVYLVLIGDDEAPFVVEDKTKIELPPGIDIDVNNLLKQTFGELKHETFQDFDSKNKEASRLEKNFQTKKSYFLIDEKELDEFFDKGSGWEGFYKKYPKSSGFYTFSRVGFSKNKDQALVFVARSCGEECGTGIYCFLKNENGKWKLVKTQLIWIS